VGLRTEVKRAAGDFDGPPGFEGARGAQLLMPLFFMTEGYGRPTGHEWATAQGPRPTENRKPNHPQHQAIGCWPSLSKINSGRRPI